MFALGAVRRGSILRGAGATLVGCDDPHADRAAGVGDRSGLRIFASGLPERSQPFGMRRSLYG